VNVHCLDPLSDPRWRTLLERHPAASVFHSTGWLQALRLTYGYRPVVLTTSAPGDELHGGLVACEVRTFVGARLVSVPFADHCDPLVDQAEFDAIGDDLSQRCRVSRWRYVELRPPHDTLPLRRPIAGWGAATSYCLHRLSLVDGPEVVFGRLHRSCIQRAIHRAVREGVRSETGTSERLMREFYCLFRQTRRRHGAPSQPYAWFRQLAQSLGSSFAVRVAFKDGRAIAGIVTLTFKDTIVYKYGGSDTRYHRLGAMPLLLWETVREAQGKRELDLGRTDWDQTGLLAFKDRLGARRSTLTYYRHPVPAPAPRTSWTVRAARRLVTIMPDPAMTLVGRVVYRYLG